MRRATLIGLIFLTASGGCTTSRDPRFVAAYVPGQKPTSKKIRYDGIVELYARDHPADGPITSTGVPGGTRVGFRAQADGSIVAFVGERTVPIPDGRCEWVIAESSWPRWWSRRAEDAERAARLTGEAVGIAAIGLGLAGLVVLYGIAESNSNPF